ncbi:unnamed protein product [Nippostrongylus brasiliensis]|uniref:Williams-Beuren syndrome chromosomal region 16 protein (inferred by orthology to a human protein) n=1 Tax=Nippostrongylus brasiliensis TaxID=27835 RepID=A0A0N4Y4D4_NIPBR|nr:unnamed protein product [Nippostrongylus brasiliensis]
MLSNIVARRTLSKAKVVKKVAASSKKKPTSAVYGCGLSASGALAIPRLVVNSNVVTSKEAHKPLRISSLNTREIRFIAAGFGFSLFASKDKLYGSATTSGVYAFGDNVHGQCGQDPERHKEVHGLSDSPLPAVEIPSDSPVVGVHCALDSSYVLTERGEVFAFGLNEDGHAKLLQAMLLTRRLFLSPEVPILSWHCRRTATFFCGVYVWGVGLLGLGPAMQKLDRPVQMDPPLFGKEKIEKVFAGNTSAAALTANGRLYVWGQNRYGLLGLEHGKDQYFPFQIFFPLDVKHASLGPDHSLFLLK